MPEETIISTDVPTILVNLEDNSPGNHMAAIQNYNLMKNILDKDKETDVQILNRILAVCVQDMATLKYSATVISIINIIISKVKFREYDPALDFAPSALALIGLLKKIALLNRVEALMTLGFETLLSHPDSALRAAAEQHEEVMELFNLYCQMRIPMQTRLQACHLLFNILTILPPEKKTSFVENGISVWFSKIIPAVMSHNALNGSENELTLKVLELLTEELVHLNYTDNRQWQIILECICNTRQYPAMMKDFLQSGNAAWCRLWIVFIKLLKDQITQSFPSVGTPINSMLPVVEAAFKLDVTNRCRAFECWNVLIDSFSAEVNESNINKRIKLLIIPLKSNNAKVEKTALAKFKCWWHLIRKFQNRMDQFLDTVLLSFLHFCFGKHNSEKVVIVPGQISANLKKHCNQAIVDMVGHAKCDGCTDLPKLKSKVINTKHLVDNWNHWIYSLTSVIMRTANGDDGLTNQQMKCLWKSFMMTIGELPENNIRKDLVSEVLSIVAHMVQECKSNNSFLDITINILIISLFDEDAKLKQLFRSGIDPNDPIPKVLRILLDPSFHGIHKSLPSSELITKFKNITRLIVDDKICIPKDIVNWLLAVLPANDIALMMWDALAKSLSESKYNHCLYILPDILVWPLKSIHFFTDVKIPAQTWYKTYDQAYPNLIKTDTEKDVLGYVLSTPNAPTSAVFFKLYVILGVLRYKFNENNCAASEREINLLHNLTKSIDTYENFEQIFPLLVDRIVAIMNVMTSKENDAITALILICAKNVLSVLTQSCKQQYDVSHIMVLIGNLLKPLETLFTVNSYSKLIPAMTYHLLKCSPLLSDHKTTEGIILAVMKSILQKTNTTDANYNRVKSVIDEIENRKMKTEVVNVEVNENYFTTPQNNNTPKRIKKKEANIVNTVIENGEEYVVVQSNWKFNPRKLTENQKEKLQRKREDIPALYQDLSQSQDEFRLTSWKAADSQDTTSSSRSESKSSKQGNDVTATEILKNLPSTNVVPKILETFFSGNDRDNNIVALPKDNVSIIEVSTPTAKNTKLPRMALKDRVFRNVRNLIENSTLQKENKDSSEDANKTDNNVKTPTNSKNIISVNVVNSAPPLLSADRPSRVKRKPKKFEDLQLLMSKKSRQSLQDVRSDGSEQISEVALIENDSVKNSKETAAIATPNEDKDKLDEDNDVIFTGITHIQQINWNSINETITIDEVEATTSKEDLKTSLEPDIVMCDNCDNDEIGENLNVNSKHVDDPVALNNVNESSTPNNVKDVNEASIASKDVNDISTAKTFKDINEVLTPKVSSVKEDSLSITSNEDKEIVTARASVIKETLTTEAPKVSNETAIATTFADDDVTQVSILELSKDLKEASATKIIKETLTPSAAKKVEGVSNPKQTQEIKEASTPKQSPKGEEQKSTAKKSVDKKSRIEKELAIDMVEGHPYLKKIQSAKRLTRKALESASTGRRKTLAEKLNKFKSESTPKSEKKAKEKNRDSDNTSSSSVVVDESQERDSESKEQSSFYDEITHSDDVIESSQDSTITTISVKSTKKTPKKVPVVCVEKLISLDKADINISQSILDCGIIGINKSPSPNCENKDDSDLPLNKTVLEDKTQEDLTENMDTEPVDGVDISEDVMPNKDGKQPLPIASEITIIGPETQEIAEADTQPTNPKHFTDIEVTQDNISETPDISVSVGKPTDSDITDMSGIESQVHNIPQVQPVPDKSLQVYISPNRPTLRLSEVASADINQSTGPLSPFKDEAQRQQDFLNNTIQISPIKTMSPERNKTSPSPETSSDYVVIKLSSPVHSNGEPFGKYGSPEVFTEDKVSPDKRDQSPPRVEISVTNTSPSSSLTLKKNRPQVRSGGRAAQMLGLCVPDKIQTIVNPERSESEEVKKSSTPNTAARRNLRILYNSVSENIDSNIGASDNDDSDNFLKFRRTLPAVDSSPSGPILKRKFAEITDDAMISPASKRKRVSFHDPPVSTTISVQKYIEPSGLRSPQNSAQKRFERQLRQHTPLKSPKRLDNVFKLDTVLTKTVESFSEGGIIAIPDDTQQISLEETPVVEIVRSSDLNDTDPICRDLLGCKDPIGNIAAELSSPAMKSLFLKELEGKLETVGDLAKMTELEISRLCIKAPKIKVAKQVLTEYNLKRVEKIPSEITVTIDKLDEPMVESEVNGIDAELQTDNLEYAHMEVQTSGVATKITAVQTERVPTAHCRTQTNESSSKSTADVIQSCLSENPDFVEQLGVSLEESSIRQISERLSLSAVTDLLMKKITPSDTKAVIKRIVQHGSSSSNDQSKELSFIREYLCERFDSKDLVLFCSQVLKTVYDTHT